MFYMWVCFRQHTEKIPIPHHNFRLLTNILNYVYHLGVSIALIGDEAICC